MKPQPLLLSLPQRAQLPTLPERVCVADATGQDLSLGQEGGSDSQAVSFQDHIVWRWLLSPSVQAIIKGKHLAIAQLLVPKEFCCKGKIKGLNLAFLLKAQFVGSDQAKGSLCPPLIPHLPGATKYIGSDLLAAMKASWWRGDHWSWAGEPLSWTPRQPSVPGAPTRSSQRKQGRCF